MSTTESLQAELATFEQHKALLLKDEGKFVVIHDQEVAGVWGTYEDALRAGYQKYGLQSFLVKQI